MQAERNFKERGESQVETWKRGMWQYLLDHSSVNQIGNHTIHFQIRSKGNFWGRVQSRAVGDYKSCKAEEKEDLALYLQAIRKQNDFVERMDVVEFDIKKKGSCKSKIALYCYKKLRNYLTNYKCEY